MVMMEADMANSDFGIGLAKMAKNGAHTSSTAVKPTANKAKAASSVAHSGVAAGKRARDASATRKHGASRGLAVTRRFTRPGQDPLDTVVYERRSSTITNPDGSIV